MSTHLNLEKDLSSSIDFFIKRAIIARSMEVKTLSQLVELIFLRKIAFLLAFFTIFTISYAFLAWADFLPEMVEKENAAVEVSEVEAATDFATITPTIVEYIEETVAIDNNNSVSSNGSASTFTDPVYPTSIYIEALDRRVDVLNPTSRNIADLDEALLEGVVRHPDSATLDRTGTVFLLGHSSYLPVVNNKSFQAFNGIQKLKWGELIEVTTAQGKYIYRISKVYRAKAENVTVPIAGDKKRLVLATCNSFGSTDDRYIVEAEIIEERLF